MKKRKIISVVLFLIFIATAVGCLYQPTADYIEVSQEEKEMAEFVKTEVKDGKEIFWVDWDKLLKINEDIIAWIRIPDTSISFPVLKCENGNQYLRRDIHHQHSHAGCIFTHPKMYEPFYSGNTIIYGHNLNNGKMFSSLRKWFDDDYLSKHNEIYIYLPDGNVQRYRIYARGNVKSTNSKIYNAFIYDEKQLADYYSDTAAYVERIEKNNNKERIITLSTCTNISNSGRYIIQAGLVEELDGYATKWNNDNDIIEGEENNDNQKQD